MPENTHNEARQYEDEITLYDLYRILAEKKAILISTIVILLLAASAYLFVVPPTYEAELRLLPSTHSILSLSTPGHRYTEFDAKTIFLSFQSHLKLTEQWQQFVVENPALFSPETNISRSDSLSDHPIKISKNKNFPAEHVDVAFQHEESSAAAIILKRYLEFSREKYVDNLIAQVNDRLEKQRENISADIAMLRQKARLERGDEIKRLRQDLKLAKVLGIADNLLVASGDAARGSNDITIIATNEIMRSYMRGTRVLSAELEALIERESDDPYIYGLREYEIELERINSLQLMPLRFKPYIQDGEVVTPMYPIAPNKKLVLALAAFLSVFLGMMLAYLINAFQVSRPPPR